MSCQNQLRLMAGLTLLMICLNGCAANGRRNFSAMRPFGSLPNVQPGTGLQSTPAMPNSPQIQPGPALPDADGYKFHDFPESVATPPRGRGRRPWLPAVTPRPQLGTPIARDENPASLSGGIEIIPGPTLRARRARMEMLPPPPAETAPEVEILKSPGEGRFEELPPPA